VCSSDLGVGTLVRVTLPFEEAMPAPAPKLAPLAGVNVRATAE